MANSTTADKPQTIRVFYAVRPDSGTRELLTREVSRLGSADRRLRWLEPDNWHVTMRFIGDVAATLRAPLVDSLESTASQHAGFTVKFHALEAFPSARRPIVVAATGDAPQGEALAYDLEHACVALGLAAESRRWRCHLTLARIRSRRDFSFVQQAVDIAFDCVELHLMQSSVIDDKRCYRSIASAPLRGC